MVLFLSTYINKIDKKGRVSVPSSFRSLLISSGLNSIILYRSFHCPALEGCGFDFLERINQKVDSLTWFSDDYEDLKSTIFADSFELSFDGEGRIILPESLINYAQLKNQTAFVGRGSNFQVWDPVLFNEYQEQARHRLKTKLTSLLKIN